MLEFTIPGSNPIRVQHLVLDYNGTIAVGGMLLEGVLERLHRLESEVKIHIVTTDIFGTVRKTMGAEGFEVVVLGAVKQDKQKKDYVWLLGSENAIVVGNGRNDARMFEEAAFSIGVMEAEGAHMPTILKADVVFRGATEALDALIDPKRLVACLHV